MQPPPLPTTSLTAEHLTAPQPAQNETVATGPQQQFTPLQNIGTLIFVVTAGFGGLEQAGFGFGSRLGLPTFLGIATLGGAVGGVLLARSARWAGLLGGALAGACGLLAVYYYVLGRQRVWFLELIVVQGLASLPGVGVYYLLRALASLAFPRRPADEE